MNTGFLSTPAPSNGYDAVLAALQPHAAPAEGSLGGTTPTVHNRVKQTFINPVASYPFIARKWAHNWEQSFHAGDLMFIFTGRTGERDPDSDLDGGDTAGMVQTRKHSVLANLPVLNHIMRLAQVDRTYEQFKNPASWNFIGVMRNSSAASGLNPRVQSKRGGNALVPDRIINIDVRGATRMFNYWEGARAGAHLWLVWRELDFGGSAKARHGESVLGHAPPKRRRHELIDNGTNVRYRNAVTGASNTGTVMSSEQDGAGDARSYTIRPVHSRVDVANIPAENVVQEEHSTCWQLLPYSGAATDDEHGYGGVNYKPVKVWWSEQTVESRTYKRPFCVGWVFQGIGAGEVSDSRVAIRKATQLAESRFQLPMIHAFLHV